MPDMATRRYALMKYKRNINFLDKPLFIPSRVDIPDTLYDDGRGYEISCELGLPVAHDIHVLNHLMCMAQDNNRSTVQFDSMKELISLLGYSDGSANYTMVERSLNKWSDVVLRFRSSSFYVRPGRRESHHYIRVLDRWDVEGNKVRIVINSRFLSYNMMKYSISFNLSLMCILAPYSRRLYEILKKNDGNFKRDDGWRIGFDKMRAKLPVLSQISDARLLSSLIKSCRKINRAIRQRRSRYYYWVARSQDNRNVLTFTRHPRSEDEEEDYSDINLDLGDDDSSYFEE